MRSYQNQPSGTVGCARQLRREASSPERHLLRALREAFPDLKWRHQCPIGPHYADILCFSERLVIEVDGATHAETQADDARRTAFIERKGYRVLRFWNNDVTGNTEGVLAAISLSLREREGAPQARKGEDRASARPKGDAPLSSPSHSPAASGPLPLPTGEGL